jgi:hypothetical protein
MANALTISDYAKAINTSWHRTTENVLETARLCAEAKSHLNKPDEKKLVQALDFSPSIFSKLVKIGSRPELQSDRMRSLLPPNYSIVYQIAKLGADEFDQAVKDGVISPRMTRDALNDWVASRHAPGEKSEATPHLKIIATLQVPEGYDADKVEKLEKELEKLKAKYGFALERPRNPEEEAFNRLSRNLDDFIRREARRYVKKLKQTRLGSGRKLSASQRQRRWGFKDDEVDIAKDATWDDVKTVLERVGSPDQFDRIRDEAFRVYGMPEDYLNTHDLDDHDVAMSELRTVIEQLSQISGRQPIPPVEQFSDFE